MKRRKQPVTLTLDEARHVLAVCGDDGHSIISTAAFDEHSPYPVNRAFVKRYARTHTSDGSPKGTIDGDPRKSVFGIHTLEILRGVCVAFGLQTESAFGRGTQARIYSRAIREHLQQQAERNGGGYGVTPLTGEGAK